MATYYFESFNGEIKRKAPYDEITHFVSGHKFVTAHYTGGELLLSETLKELSENHPELVYTHRPTLVRRDDIDRFWRHKKCHNYSAQLKSGLVIKVSRTQYKAIRAIVNGEGK